MSTASKRAGFLHRYGNTPQTHTVISSRSKVYAVPAGGTPNTYEQIGVMSRFQVQQNRDVTPVNGIGFGDVIAELVPGRQGPITISVSRAALYLMGVFQSFGYAGGVDGLIRALRQHRWPFDIKQELIFSDRAINTAHTGSEHATSQGFEKDSGSLHALITLYEACWMTSHSADYGVDNAVVMEEVSISATDMCDFRGSKRNLPAGEDNAGVSKGGNKDFTSDVATPRTNR